MAAHKPTISFCKLHKLYFRNRVSMHKLRKTNANIFIHLDKIKLNGGKYFQRLLIQYIFVRVDRKILLMAYNLVFRVQFKLKFFHSK